MSLHNLTSQVEYYAYVIGGSVHPGYPDLMDASKIVRLKFKTMISPEGKYIFPFSIYSIWEEIYFFLCINDIFHINLN